jgi:C4-dicarboxylate transporter DctQ subunit
MLVATMFIEVCGARCSPIPRSGAKRSSAIRSSTWRGSARGGGQGTRAHPHRRDDAVCRPRTKALLYIFGDIVMFAVAVIALYWSFETVHVSAKFGSVSHGLRISQVWFLMAVPIGFALVIFRLSSVSFATSPTFETGTPVYEGDKLFD